MNSCTGAGILKPFLCTLVVILRQIVYLPVKLSINLTWKIWGQFPPPWVNVQFLGWECVSLLAGHWTLRCRVSVSQLPACCPHIISCQRETRGWAQSCFPPSWSELSSKIFPRHQTSSFRQHWAAPTMLQCFLDSFWTYLALRLI